MSAVTDAPVTQTEAADAVATFADRNRLPKARLIDVARNLMHVHLANTDDLVRWAWCLGRTVTVAPAEEDGEDRYVVTWLSGDPLVLRDVPLPVLIFGPDVKL